MAGYSEVFQALSLRPMKEPRPGNLSKEPQRLLKLLAFRGRGRTLGTYFHHSQRKIYGNVGA